MKYTSFPLTFASICLLIGTSAALAVPIGIVPEKNAGPIECDGCKWLVGKVQTYLKNSEQRIDNLTETALETNICSHIPSKDSALCDALVEKYVPVAFDSLVEKIADPTFVCTEVAPLCSQTLVFQLPEHRVESTSTIQSCSTALNTLHEYLTGNVTTDIINQIFTECKQENSDNVLECEAISKHVSSSVLSYLFQGVDMCESHIFMNMNINRRRLLEAVEDTDESDNESEDDEADAETSDVDESEDDEADAENSDVDESDDDEADAETGGVDESDDDEADAETGGVDENEDDEADAENSDVDESEDDEADAENSDVDESEDDEADAENIISDNNDESNTVAKMGSGRRLLRFKRIVRQVRHIFHKPKSPPPPAPKPAPAPKPVIKSAPPPAPESKNLKPKKKKNGFLKKGFSVIKNVGKAAVKVAKVAAPAVVPALKVIPVVGPTLSVVTSIAPKVNSVVNKFSPKVKDALKKVAKKAGSKVNDALKKAEPKIKDVLKKVAKKAGSKVKDALKKAEPKVKDALKKAAKKDDLKKEEPKVKDALKKVANKAEPKVKDALKKAAKKAGSKVKDALKKVAKKAGSKVKDALKKAEPKVKDALKKAAKKAGSKVKDALKKAGTKIKTKLKKLVPTKLYGNYCGPNYCGGQNFKGAEGPNCRWGVASKDALDECCKAHDRCCGTESTRSTNCNKEILACAKKAKCSGTGCVLAKAAVKTAFTIGKNKVCGNFFKKNKTSSNALVSAATSISASNNDATDESKADASDASDKPAADGDANNADPASVSDDGSDTVSVSKEIVENIPSTNEKVNLLKDKLVSIMSEMDSKDKQLETETQSNVYKVETDVKNEDLRIQAARKSLTTLYNEMVSLNATIQIHYNTLLSDSDYIQSLDKMRPRFMKSLDKLTAHIEGIKTLVDNKLIKDDYKDEMLTLLNGIRFNAQNISGYVANAFINHYNKYKSRIQGDNTKYLSSVTELSKLSQKYKLQQKKTVGLENERARLESILLKLKTTLKTSKKTQSQFENMFKQILAIFDKNANSRC